MALYWKPLHFLLIGYPVHVIVKNLFQLEGFFSLLDGTNVMEVKFHLRFLDVIFITFIAVIMKQHTQEVHFESRLVKSCRLHFRYLHSSIYFILRHYPDFWTGNCQQEHQHLPVINVYNLNSHVSTSCFSRIEIVGDESRQCDTQSFISKPERQ